LKKKENTLDGLFDFSLGYDLSILPPAGFQLIGIGTWGLLSCMAWDLNVMEFDFLV
jgi:hypothetical protein